MHKPNDTGTQSVKVVSYECIKDDVLSLSGLGDGYNVTRLFDSSCA